MKRIGYILIVILLSLSGKIFSQELSELKKERDKNRLELEEVNKILNETLEEKEYTVNRLKLLNKRIKLRSTFIKKVKEEIEAIDDNISKNNQKIDSLNKKLEIIKNEYSKLVYDYYKKRSKHSHLMYILSSDGFNQAYKRMKYLQQYSEYRTIQYQQISEIKGSIVLINEKLVSLKDEKASLLGKKEREKISLEKEENKKSKYVKDLKGKEEELKLELKKKQEIANKLAKEITKVIEEINRKTQGINKLTPAEKIISTNFSKNRGGLPWPTKNGIVTENFGINKHAELNGAQTINNGIDISTVSNSKVRAIFEGEVKKVVAILGANYTVIIRHGEFLTVYQNLIDVNVKNGDVVKTKQIIGTVAKNNSGENVIHFEIWKEYQKLNPIDWLSK